MPPGRASAACGTILVMKAFNEAIMQIAAPFVRTFETRMHTGEVRYALTYSSVHE